jgi:hypothetical protein
MVLPTYAWDLEQEGAAAAVFLHEASPERRRRNGLGSTDRLTDTNQDVDTSSLYRAFGEQSVLSGSHANPFGWVGRLGYYRQSAMS